MKAVLLDEFGKPMRVGDAPRPAPRDDEVLVRVEACGVCHSDLHMADGDWPDVAKRMTLPAILGHEVVGRVVEIGAGVTGIKAGDRAGVGWLYSTCGACEFCRDGHENICRDRQVTGVAAPGGFAEFIRIRASHAIPVPESLPAAEAAPLFCAGLTVYHACRNAGLRAGQRVAVFGVGGLGHLAVQLARRAGAEVIAVDTGDDKLALAKSLGAHTTINAAAPDVARQLRRDGGPHLAIVTAPAKPAYDLAFRTLRRRGTLAVVGLPKEDLTFFADDWVVGEFAIVGSAVGTRDEMRELLALAAAGEVKCRTESYPLDAVNEVFERMRRGALLGRAVVVPAT
jgi:propanol-preferring alcohol dehydrogenase